MRTANDLRTPKRKYKAHRVRTESRGSSSADSSFEDDQALDDPYGVESERRPLKRFVLLCLCSFGQVNSTESAAAARRSGAPL